jgi:hypothetical protein
MWVRFSLTEQPDAATRRFGAPPTQRGGSIVPAGRCIWLPEGEW